MRVLLAATAVAAGVVAGLLVFRRRRLANSLPPVAIAYPSRVLHRIVLYKVEEGYEMGLSTLHEFVVRAVDSYPGSAVGSFGACGNHSSEVRLCSACYRASVPARLLCA